MSARAAAVYHQYAPLGQFRPWALLWPPEYVYGCRLTYPTFICTCYEHSYLYDVLTGSHVRKIELRLLDPLRSVCDVDVSERYALVCESHEVRVISRESGSVLRIRVDVTVWCSQCVEDSFSVVEHTSRLITPIPVHPKVVEFRPSPCPDFIAGVSTHALSLIQRFSAHISHSSFFQGRPRSRCLVFLHAVLLSFETLSVSFVERLTLNRRCLWASHMNFVAI